MKANLIIDGSRKDFDSLKELRKYLSGFDTIPQVQSLFVEGKSISFLGLCYFMINGEFYS